MSAVLPEQKKGSFFGFFEFLKTKLEPRHLKVCAKKEWVTWALQANLHNLGVI